MEREYTNQLSTLALKKTNADFREALSKRDGKTALELWDRNEELRTYYFYGKGAYADMPQMPDERYVLLLECANNFKVLLSGPSNSIIKSVWNANEELRHYCCGLKVNFGTKAAPDLRDLSHQGCVDYFKSILRSGSKEVILSVWNSNEKLRAYFGDLETAQNIKEKIARQHFSLQECADNFKLVLSSHCREVIYKIWNSNEELRDYFSGKAINLCAKESPEEQYLLLLECANNFKSILASRYHKIVKSVWNSNQWLRAYFCGQDVNFGTRDNPKVRSLSLQECSDNFKLILRSRCPEVIQEIWRANKELQSYFVGQEVNLGTKGSPDLRRLSLSERVDNFKAILTSRCGNVVQAVWVANKELRDYFCGSMIDFGTTEAPDFRQLSLQKSINNFKAILSSNVKDIILTVWNSNERLREHFCDKNANLYEQETPEIQKHLLQESINNFRSVLSGQCKEVTNSMWNSNSWLRDYFCGQGVEIYSKEGSGLRCIFFQECANTFKMILTNRCFEIIRMIWNNNKMLRSYFCGQDVNFGTRENPKVRRLSLSEGIDDFKFALSSRCKEVILDIWNTNETLQDYFCGKKVNFGTKESPDLRSLSLQECLDNFMLILSSRRTEFIMLVWNANENMQAYFSGQPVNFGTEETPAIRRISLQEYIDSFRSILLSQCREIIRKLWNSNDKLRIAISGKEVNFGTKKEPDIQSLPLEECINTFKSVLSSHCFDIIRAIWDSNEELRAYFSGQEANFGTSEAPDWRCLSLQECIDVFKPILTNRCKEVVCAVWKANGKLKACFGGQEVNFGTTEAPDFRRPSAQESINNFKSILTSKCVEIVEDAWNDNYRLQEYVNGQAVNFGSGKNSDWQHLSLLERVELFKTILSSCCKKVIVEVWDANEALQAYFCGQEVNFGTKDSPELRRPSMQQCVDSLKLILSSKRKEIILAVLSSNKELWAYFSGREVNFGTKESPDFQRFSLQECINNFRSLLRGRCKKVTMEMWNANEELRAYFGGQEVNFGTKESPDFRRPSAQESINNFRSLLTSKCGDVVRASWDSNERLRAYFCGQEVNFGTEEDPDLRRLSLQKCADNFKSMLPSQQTSIIRAIWNANVDLRSYYNGSEVNVGTRETPDLQRFLLVEQAKEFTTLLLKRCTSVALEVWHKNENLLAYFSGKEVNFGAEECPDVRSLSLEECVDKFKCILQSNCGEIIKEVWNNSDLLVNGIYTLSMSEQKELLKKVMSSKSYGKGGFIDIYIPQVKNEKVLAGVLEEISPAEGKKLSPYKQNQIDALQDRIKVLATCKAQAQKQQFVFYGAQAPHAKCFRKNSPNMNDKNRQDIRGPWRHGHNNH